MIAIFLFALSVGLQLTAAVYALLLIRITGRKLAWLSISVALVLMTSRRIVTLVVLLKAGKAVRFDTPEIIALTVSCLLLLGVLLIRDFFLSFNRAEAERMRGEQEIRRLNVELQQKIAELKDAQEELVRKEKLAILGQLSGSVGHELRNPLGVMSNAVYFLKMVLTETDETVQEYLGIIKKEIDESLRIITDLLDFARTKPPQIKTVTARALIDETLGRCTVPATVELHDEVPQTLPPLTIDPLQMGQVLQNLIMNAIQAMPAGGTITLRGRRDSEGTVRLEVADTGEGISPENMKNLFQPLFTTKPKGIGLGLVVCRNLTVANGGRIEVESEQGKGAVFTMVLPA